MVCFHFEKMALAAVEEMVGNKRGRREEAGGPAYPGEKWRGLSHHPHTFSGAVPAKSHLKIFPSTKANVDKVSFVFSFIIYFQDFNCFLWGQNTLSEKKK